MADYNSGVRHVFFHQSLQAAQGCDAIGHNKDLPVATHFKINRFGDDLMIECVDFRLDGAPIRWGRLNHRQVAGAHQ